MTSTQRFSLLLTGMLLLSTALIGRAPAQQSKAKSQTKTADQTKTEGEPEKAVRKKAVRKAKRADPALSTPAGNSLTMKPGREFAADSYVHRRLPDNAEIDPHSAGYVRDLLRQIKTFYGVVNVNTHEFTPPVYLVSANQPTMRVKAWDRNDPKWAFPPLQEQWRNVPLPETFLASPGTDQEAVVYQPSTGRYWEFWQMQKTGAKVLNSAGQSVDEWGARWGGRIDDLAHSPGYFPPTPEGFKYGTTATGLCLLAGLVTIEEQQRGVINHALHIAVVEALNSRWSPPAQRSDGQITLAQNPEAIPEGATFRFPASLSLDALDMDPYARMIARAVQKYGLVVRDRSGGVTLYAENPANRYAQDPYTKAGGILNRAGGVYGPSCWPNSNGRLRGFPWDKLQVLKSRPAP